MCVVLRGEVYLSDGIHAKGGCRYRRSQWSFAAYSLVHSMHTQCPEEAHHAGKAFGALAAPIVPNLGDKLDAPAHRADGAEYIGSNGNVCLRLHDVVASGIKHNIDYSRCL